MSQKETILITGAHGAIAGYLKKRLSIQFNLKFLTRTVKKNKEYFWDVKAQKIDPMALNQVDHILHLAGANILSKRWSDKRKKEIIESRIQATKLLQKSLIEQNILLKSFISASAIGIYGANTSEHIYREEDTKGTDFLAEVCLAWEKAAQDIKDVGCCERVVLIRTGVVLSPKGGALAPMLIPIKLGLGSPLGSGNQYIPWIHINDLCGMYERAISTKSMQGAYNACAPEAITNLELTKILADELHKPLFMPAVPIFLLKIALGEAAVMVYEGSRVSAEKIQANGYVFEYPEIRKAVQNLLQRTS